jgi:hypothetical protein
LFQMLGHLANAFQCGGFKHDAQVVQVIAISEVRVARFPAGPTHSWVVEVAQRHVFGDARAGVVEQQLAIFQREERR